MAVGTWRSLVARTLGVREVAGSNPVVPTTFPALRGEPMEEEKAPPQGSGFRTLTYVLAFVVTLDVVVRTARRWESLAILSRILAVALIACLAVMPLSTLTRRERERFGLGLILSLTYMLVLATVQVFDSH